jgi:hypothetical protein
MEGIGMIGDGWTMGDARWGGTGVGGDFRNGAICEMTAFGADVALVGCFLFLFSWACGGG